MKLATDNDKGCVCVFVGSKNPSYHILTELARKLNEALSTVDVIHVHGSLDKNEKYWFIRLFCAGITIPELRAKNLLATAVQLPLGCKVVIGVVLLRILELFVCSSENMWADNFIGDEIVVV